MSSVIVCPTCQARYPARPDLYGRQVQCKRCQQPFVPEAPPPEQDYALAGLLDEAIAEKAAAQERAQARAEEEGQERARKKKKKPAPRKHQGVTLFGVNLSKAVSTQTYVLTILLGYGLVTLIGLLSKGDGPIYAFVPCFIATKLNVIIAMIIFFNENEGNAGCYLLMALFFCSPIFFAWMLFYYFTHMSEHPVFFTHLTVPLVCCALLVIRVAAAGH